MRLDYFAVSPEPVKALAGVNAALLRAGFDRRFTNLLFLRVSQINGCSYCLDEHARDLRAEGEANERLDGLAGWREVVPGTSGGGHYLIMSFAARWRAGDPVLNDELDDFRWLAPDALGDLKVTGGLQEVIRAARDLLRV